MSLTASIYGGKSKGNLVTILARESNPRGCTHASEVVRCQLAGESELQVLCKYGTGLSHTAYGHRGGIPYEAEVYRQVLQPLSVSAPNFYGAHTDSSTGETWIILEYLDRTWRINDSRARAPIRMQAAARWLVHFHRVNEARFQAEPPFLKKHDADYYLGWANRTAILAGPLHERFPWLATLCRRFTEVVVVLLEPPAIVIHGEYYPGNILYRKGTVYPVDWESAAVAIGEIDVASLIEGWSPEIVGECQAEYQAARWPEGSPADFDRKLAAAQLYWNFRWLGERREWTHQENALKRFALLRSLGERFGLI